MRAMNLQDLLCDRCYAVFERFMALMERPDAFYATAAVLGDTQCEKCTARIDKFFADAAKQEALRNGEDDPVIWDGKK